MTSGQHKKGQLGVIKKRKTMSQESFIEAAISELMSSRKAQGKPISEKQARALLKKFPSEEGG